MEEELSSDGEDRIQEGMYDSEDDDEGEILPSFEGQKKQLSNKEQRKE